MLDFKSILTSTKTISADLGQRLLTGETSTHISLSPANKLKIAERARCTDDVMVGPHICLPPYAAELVCEYLGKDCSPGNIAKTYAHLIERCEEESFASDKAVERVTIVREFEVDKEKTVFLSEMPKFSNSDISNTAFIALKSRDDEAILKATTAVIDLRYIRADELDAAQTWLDSQFEAVVAIADKHSLARHKSIDTHNIKVIQLEEFPDIDGHELMKVAQFRAHVIDDIEASVRHFIAHDYPSRLSVENGHATVTLGEPVKVQAYDPKEFGDLFHLISPEVTFDDVIGNEHIKDDFRDLIHQLKDPDCNIDDLPSGILFEGEPGTGKTYMAQAAANAVGLPFVVVDCAAMAANGSGVANVHQLFALLSRVGKCIVFFDEFDSLGRKRDESSHAHVTTINTLLAQMDGAAQQSEGAIFIAATNHISMLDPALMRAGRFGKSYTFVVPNAGERMVAIENAIQKYEVPLEPEQITVINRLTHGMTFKAIQDMFRELTGQRSQKTGAHFDLLLRSLLTEFSGPIGHEYEDDDNLYIRAVHEAGHFIAAQAEYPDTPVDLVSAKYSIMVASEMMNNLPRCSKTLQSYLSVVLGGRAAEAVMFGDDGITTGSINDIDKATAVAKQVLKGLGRVANFDGVDASQLRSFETLVDQEVAETMHRVFEHTKNLIRHRLPLLKTIAEQLMTSDYLLNDDLSQIGAAVPMAIPEYDSAYCH